MRREHMAAVTVHLSWWQVSLFYERIYAILLAFAGTPPHILLP